MAEFINHVVMTLDDYDGMEHEIRDRQDQIDALKQENKTLRDKVAAALHDELAEDYRYLGGPSFDFTNRWSEVAEYIGYEFPADEREKLIEWYHAWKDAGKNNNEEVKA